MAKLVEILARELVEWKKNADGAVFSSKGGACYFFHGNKPAYDDYNWRATEGCFWFVGESDKLVLNGDTPDDHATAIVTRAEWQAAVDALRAKDVVEWDGVGLPPVGTVCTCYYQGSYQGKVRVEYIGKNACVLLNLEHEDEQCGMTDYYQFNPIRTPEQIAAEDREKAVGEMCRITGSHIRSTMSDAFRKIYDAGYRKQEPK